MFRSKDAKTYDLSKLNPWYVAVVIFIICLLAGKNAYCDKFYRISKLPKNRNETSIVQSTFFLQSKNKFHFIIKTNYIFEITKRKFRENFAISFQSSKLTYRLDESSFYSNYFPKNEWQFDILIPFTGRDIEITYFYRNTIIKREINKVNILELETIVENSSFAYDNHQILDFYSVCLFNNSLIDFSQSQFYLKHFLPIPQISNKKSMQQLSIETNSPIIEQNSKVFFNSPNMNQYIDALKYSFLPLFTEYIKQKEKREKISLFVNNKDPDLIFKSFSWNPLVQIVKSLHEIKVHESNNTCFKKLTIPQQNNQFNEAENSKANLKMFRDLLNVKDEGDKVIIIESPLISSIYNMFPFIRQLYPKEKIITIKETTDPNKFVDALTSAKAIFISRSTDLLSLVAVPSNCQVFRISKNDDNESSIQNWEKELLEFLGQKHIEYIDVESREGTNSLIY